MATRKIRLTLSGTKLNDMGPIIDVDFNNENLDADFEVTAVQGESTVTREYTVDVAAGNYDLTVEYKNDDGRDTDRNLYLEKLELANDGINYQTYMITDRNTNLSAEVYFPNGMSTWVSTPNPNFDENTPKSYPSNTPSLPNSNFDSNQPATDDATDEDGFSPPGTNPRFVWTPNIIPVTVWANTSIIISTSFT